MVDYIRRSYGVDPRLVGPVLYGALAFEREHLHLVRITEGLRSIERQWQMIREGKSDLKNAHHGYHPKGKAIDLAIIGSSGAIWDLKLYEALNGFIQDEAQRLGSLITWGGDWGSVDAVHWQLETLELDPDW